VNGTTVFSNVFVTNFIPQVGDRFVFGARCGALSEELRLDDVLVVTKGNLSKIPTTAPYYKSGEYDDAGQTADKAFDGLPNTKWLVQTATGYIGATVQSPPRTVSAYTVTSAEDVPERDPAGWFFESTIDDGTNWLRYSTTTGTKFMARKETHVFAVPSPTAANAYRILIPANGGDANLQLAEITFYEMKSYTTGLPSAVTESASGITNTGAVLNATVNPNGWPASVWLEWGITSNYGNSTPHQFLGDGTTNIAVSAAITNLLSGRDYHFRVVAEIPEGRVYGDDVVVTLPALDPMILASPRPLGSDSAFLSGTINSQSALVTKAWFQWGETTNYDHTTSVQDVKDGNIATTIGETIGGLLRNTTYHCELVASNALGLFHSGDIAFTTYAVDVPWTRANVATNFWHAIALSGDGTTIIASSSDVYLPADIRGNLFISTNSGTDWCMATNLVHRDWTSVTASRDGDRFFATSLYNGVTPSSFVVSIDAGMTWTLYEDTEHVRWGPVASSATGTRMVAAIHGIREELMYSEDQYFPGTPFPFVPVGVLGNPVGGFFGSPTSFGKEWDAVAMSADGTKVIGATQGEPLYVAYFPYTNAIIPLDIPAGNYAPVAMSADGTTIAVVKTGFPIATTLHISTDAGTTWKSPTFPASLGTITRNPLAISADGKKIVVSINRDSLYDDIYLSTDAGETWRPITTGISGAHWSLAISLDGSTIAAAGSAQNVSELGPQEGSVYLWHFPTLKTEFAGNQLALSWTTNQIGLVLQSTTNLTSPNWMTVTDGVSVIDGKYQISVSPNVASRFFRLGE
jgi:hypothetical protein